ncbi:MAG: PilZ domain-containing protein [Deltaproteobacteria bacterium]|jgi:hypothetical protein|nr:PilZ domain-containing protein [Deltaproteobacteria bacterium]
MSFFTAKYNSGSEFLDSVNQEKKIIFCPTSMEIGLNQKVVAELHIPGAPNIFLLKGVAVAWQKAIPRNRIRSGLYLKFSTNELKRLAYYLSIFSGSIPVPPRRRKYPRLPVIMTAKARVIKKPNYFEIKIHNFSEGGARISSGKKLEINSILSIEIAAPGGVKPIPFSARVVNNPEDNLYGINFMTREHGTSSLLKEIMERFKKLSFVIFLLAFMIPGVVKAAHSYVYYDYSILKNGIINKYGLRIYSNGRLVYYKGIANSKPREILLSKNSRKFADKVFAALQEAESNHSENTPCGAPRGGKLVISKQKSSPRNLNLQEIDKLEKYGKVVRIMQKRLQPLHPESIRNNCLSLNVPAKVEILKDPGSFEKDFETTPPHSPKEHFINLLQADDLQDKLQYLMEIVTTRGSDLFFGKYLLKNHRFSDEAKKIARYFSAPLVYSVISSREGQKLLNYYSRSRSVENKYFATLLFLLNYNFSAAATSINIYYRGLAKSETGTEVAQKIRKAQKNMGRLNYGKSSWANQIRRISFLFEFWYDWARRISPPSNNAPTLAQIFYQRAFHYARMYAGNLRIGSISSTPYGRKTLRKLLPLFLSRHWYLYPVYTQVDIINVITAMRSAPKLFGGPNQVEKLIPSISNRIYELLRLRRFYAVDQLEKKYSNKIDPIILKQASGMALYHNRDYEKANKILSGAQTPDDHKSLLAYFFSILKSTNNPSNLEQPPENKIEGLSRIKFLLTQNTTQKPKKRLAQCQFNQLAAEEKLLLIKAKLSTGIPGAMENLITLTQTKSPAQSDSVSFLAHLYLTNNKSFEEVYDLLSSSLYNEQSAANWGLLATSAKYDDFPNAQILAHKAVNTAYKNPRQMISLLKLFVRFAVFPDLSYQLAQEALARFQFNPELAWLRAALFLRSGMKEQAQNEISRALQKDPGNYKYQKLAKQIQAI